MKANPGGEIAPDEAIGRDRLIEGLWAKLDQLSVIIVAERRMGKTTIVKCMRAEDREDVLLLYRDVEDIATPIEFAERVAQDIEKHLSKYKKTVHKVRKLAGQLAGTELPGIKFPPKFAPHWKALLESAIEDLIDHQGDKLCVFVWDELPLMLQKIARDESPAVAMEMLDVLRSLRQTHSRLRMMFSGSIGLHHVASELKAAGHANDATNDMNTVDVPPLDEADAIDLAGRLLRGEAIKADDDDAVARAIALEVDCIPYFIHHVVSALKSRGGAVDVNDAKQVVASALTDAQDIWHLRHFRERLATYYGNDRLPVILNVLDQIAAADRPAPFKKLFEGVKGSLKPEVSPAVSRIVHGDEEALRNLLVLLQRDHYLQLDGDGAGYRFRFGIIQRWWRIHRSL